MLLNFCKCQAPPKHCGLLFLLVIIIIIYGVQLPLIDVTVLFGKVNAANPAWSTRLISTQTKREVGKNDSHIMNSERPCLEENILLLLATGI